MHTRSGSRTLYYIPIVHTEADMGALGKALQKVKASAVGRQRAQQGVQLVSRWWDEIEQVIGTLSLPAGVRVYQDGLPICGQEDRIVSDLAAAGSRNHKLLLRLRQRGGQLMGTEAAELLVEEYEIARAALLSGTAARPRSAAADAALLERRDRFIAQRIGDTLQPGETGVLFLGMLHSLQRYLAADIEVIHPVLALAPGRRGSRRSDSGETAPARKG